MPTGTTGGVNMRSSGAGEEYHPPTPSGALATEPAAPAASVGPLIIPPTAEPAASVGPGLCVSEPVAIAAPTAAAPSAGGAPGVGRAGAAPDTDAAV